MVILLGMLSAFSLFARQQPDSMRFAALDAKLKEYVDAIEAAGPQVQKEECDFLIESTADSLVRQHVALRLYDHYLNSRVMGAEAVAIHILDEWFFSDKVKMPDDVSLLNARVYADFNRRSLIGEKAPALRVEDISGSQVCLYDTIPDRYSVLYFYDTDCAKCRIETLHLKHLLSSGRYHVDLYAFYSGSNRESWEKYVADRMHIDSDCVSVTHVWDPGMDSDFQRKYGVLQTPRMFLIRHDGVIVGRGLDTEALTALLDLALSEDKLEYGGQEAFSLFDRMLDFEGVTQDDVKSVADNIAAATLSKGDTLMFRQLNGDYLYYLAGKQGQAYKEGLDYLVDRYILSDDLNVWKSADDSLKVVGFARIMDDLLSKSVPGTRVADIRLPGLLLKKDRTREKTLSLRKLGGKTNIIIFYTDGCSVCAAEKSAARALVDSDRRKRVFLVNVDLILAEHPSLSARLFDRFDLSSLPFILSTDSKGIITGRYLSLL